MTDNFSIEENKVEGYSRYAEPCKTPFLTRFVQQIGLAKSEKQANKILIIFSILFICGALVFFILSLRQPEVKVIKIKARPVQKESISTENQSANTSAGVNASMNIKASVGANTSSGNANTQNAVLKK